MTRFADITADSTNAMKIALPLTATGQLSPHYGGAKQVAFYTLDEARRSVLAMQKVTPADARPCHWADWLAGEGVAFLLAAGIGNAPTQRMNAHGIAVHSGIYKSDPDEIVGDFMSGTLAYAQNPCARADGDDHHHHDHDHDHDHDGCGCDHH